MKSVLLILAILFWSGAVAEAGGQRPESLPQLQARATRVFVGRVLSTPKRSPFNFGDGYASFSFQIQVLQVLKTARPVPLNRVWVRFTSSTLHNGKVGAPSSAPPPPVAVGARYIFFLDSQTVVGIRPYSAALARQIQSRAR